jgi:hypothetical protein
MREGGRGEELLYSKKANPRDVLCATRGCINTIQAGLKRSREDLNALSDLLAPNNSYQINQLLNVNLGLLPYGEDHRPRAFRNRAEGYTGTSGRGS